MNVPIERKVIFSDSKVALHWLKSTRTLPVFVTNRVKELRSHNDITFRYVESAMNSSDYGTKGKSVSELKNDTLWWHGPTWFVLPPDQWPCVNDPPPIDSETLQQLGSDKRGSDVLYQTATFVAGEGSLQRENVQPPFGMKIENYSSLLKLLRVTAYVNRYLNNLNGKQTKRTSELSAQEINDAKLLWLSYVQKVNFGEQIESMMNQTKKQLSETTGLELDSNQLIRCCGSRLQLSNLPPKSIDPILLPKNDYFTELVIWDVHKSNAHSGVNHTLSQVRQEYWVPHGRAYIGNVLRKCITCRRWSGGPFKYPDMGPLPVERVQKSDVYSRVGVDYFGPLTCKDRNGAHFKTWAAIFSCMVTRNIHIELCDSLTPESFLLAFRRFTALRTKMDECMSDNAPHFHVAAKTIDEAYSKIIHDPAVQTYFANKGIKWTFIPPYASWFGAFWERMVGITKVALRRTIGKLCLSFHQLSTALYETASIVNSRPILYQGKDIQGGRSLCPSDFLMINSKTGAPLLDTENESQDPAFNPNMSASDKLLSTWVKGSKYLDQVWEVWRNEYLLSLRERYQKSLKLPRVQSHIVPKVGQIVLMGDKQPRGTWKLCMIHALNKSGDGQIRSAVVKLADGKLLTRALTQLYPLECSNVDSVSNSTETVKGIQRVSTENETSQNIPDRPKRQAKEKAKLNITKYYQNDSGSDSE